MYIVEELVGNIYEHSDFKNAYVMAQKKHTFTNLIDLCFFDNGITIPIKFGNYGIDKNPADCIEDALNGTSTKDEWGRGIGLSTSERICKELFNGELLIVSGNGLVKRCQNSDKFNLTYPLEQSKGTLISIR